MFHPEEVIFAPTAQCNLHCAHCRVTRLPEELDAGMAIAFLEDCQAAGIDRVGFSGGEPFLRPDFLGAVSEAAVGMGMLFDRLMTNGVWWKGEDELRSVLASVFEAGFDGKIGVSVDSWHDQDREKLAAFFRLVFEIWGRKDCIEILSVKAPDETACMDKLRFLAAALGGELLVEDGEPLSIADEARLRGRRDGQDDTETLFIDIIRFPYSAAGEVQPAGGAGPAPSWGDEDWFEDDFCEGPGNVLYVHPDGRVAVCCGFANEAPALILGDLHKDNFESLMKKAEAKPQVRACYEEGLGASRKRLEARGVVFPGKTKDICLFCEWLCASKLIDEGKPD